MLEDKTGKLVCLEGIDGSGKSTLARLLALNLSQNVGIKVLLTREHGGTPLGQKLREILHHREESLCFKSEFLLLAADRAQHISQVVLPALNSGVFVISDRMDDSSLAYQGYGRGLDLSMIRTVNAWAMDNLKKDLVFFIDIEPELALKRILERRSKLTVFEKEKLEFWKRVRHGYHEIFKNRPEVVKLDGRMSPDEILQQALDIINSRINLSSLLES